MNKFNQTTINIWMDYIFIYLLEAGLWILDGACWECGRVGGKTMMTHWHSINHAFNDLVHPLCLYVFLTPTCLIMDLVVAKR
jgi:hypothetical protein